MNSMTEMNKGERFGSLVYTGDKESKNRRWLGKFICDCGQECIKRIDIVKCGNTHSCGCKSPNKGYKIRKKQMGDNYPYYVLCGVYRKNAKTRKIDFSLTMDDLQKQFEKQNGKCAYTGLDLVLPKDFLHIFGSEIASIDRIDSSIGYQVGNIQFVRKAINFMKYQLSHDEFIKMCKLVVENSP
jgi:hypothetical protein